MPKVIINTSPIQYLYQTNLLDLLPQLVLVFVNFGYFLSSQFNNKKCVGVKHSGDNLKQKPLMFMSECFTQTHR